MLLDQQYYKPSGKVCGAICTLAFRLTILFIYEVNSVFLSFILISC